MAERGVPFKEIDVSKDRASAEELQRISGQLAVPVIKVDDEVVVGFDEEQLGRLVGAGS